MSAHLPAVIRNAPTLPRPLQLWSGEGALPRTETALGCWSHRGTGPRARPHGLAFAVEHVVRGERWLLCGVADGIADAGWSTRGAAHAVAAFVGSATELIDATPATEQALREPELRQTRLTRPLCARLLQRFDRESTALVASGELPPGWERPLYRDAFLDGPHAADNRMLWFQTTLLAGALGPRGGFALVLGEGTLRVDRAGGPRQPHLASDGDPARLISRWLEPDELDLGFRSLLPLGAGELQLLLGTEGVARAPQLDRFAPADDGACRLLLEELAGGTPQPADADHLALAFARRRVHV